MTNSFMSPLPTFTLESLVTDGQWLAAQTLTHKKTTGKSSAGKKDQRNASRSEKPSKAAL